MPTEPDAAVPAPAVSKKPTNSFQLRLKRLQRHRQIFHARFVSLQERAAAANVAEASVFSRPVPQPLPAISMASLEFLEPVTEENIAIAEGQLEVMEERLAKVRVGRLFYDLFVDGMQEWVDDAHPSKLWEAFAFAKTRGLYSGREPDGLEELVHMLAHVRKVLI
ncbi:hypothetical protein BJ508DRAFT_333810 [Ascobolus immersus RN42]|uniref:Uncharacterized protein n=1 Tax=Ascobolus immersus RN42 TaxID=1160509 RepID=A0A3N4HK72_ASCIM|nr:hypothetical protein BJ508DRAFT_333810 [Ascobolus immersus RN42]